MRSKNVLLGEVEPKYLTRGQNLYRGGDIKKHITACSACHSPRGRGNAQAGFPRLSGQQPAYTMRQLLAYKKRQRHTDINHMMRDIARRMDEKDRQAVAHYVLGLY